MIMTPRMICYLFNISQVEQSETNTWAGMVTSLDGTSIDKLVMEGLVEYVGTNMANDLTMTDKGEAYLEMLTSIQPPIECKAYVFNETGDIIITETN